MKISRNFTLIELLVVITIIAILAAMLLPSLNKARNMAKRIKCTSQQKQLATAVHFYTNDFDGRCPRIGYSRFYPAAWSGNVWNVADASLRAYWSGGGFHDKQIVICPCERRQGSGSPSWFNNNMDGTVSFGGNTSYITWAGWGWNGDDVRLVNSPNTTKDKPSWLLFVDRYSSTGIATMHPEGANAAIFDGHVEWVNKKSLCVDTTHCGNRQVQEGLLIPIATCAACIAAGTNP